MNFCVSVATLSFYIVDIRSSTIQIEGIVLSMATLSVYIVGLDMYLNSTKRKRSVSVAKRSVFVFMMTYYYAPQCYGVRHTYVAFVVSLPLSPSIELTYTYILVCS
jgi:hypothetical protein